MAIGETRPVDPVMEDKGFIERGAIRFVNWSRNTVVEGEEHELRGVLYKTAVVVISIAIVLFNFIVFLPGWIFLYYARQEHDRQGWAEQEARANTSNTITKLQNKVRQLEDEQKTATTQLTATASQRATALQTVTQEKTELQTKFTKLKDTCNIYFKSFTTIAQIGRGNTSARLRKAAEEFQKAINAS